jgi:hypothetical protein
VLFLYLSNILWKTPKQNHSTFNKEGDGMSKFHTSGQVAKRLRISVSTLKRWLEDPSLRVSEQRNASGWRLFSETDQNVLVGFKRELKRNGKRFKENVLIPVAQKSKAGETAAAKEGRN